MDLKNKQTKNQKGNQKRNLKMNNDKTIQKKKNPEIRNDSTSAPLGKVASANVMPCCTGKFTYGQV